ncbi:ABC-2 type transport system ATP-binding protein [Nocardioides zeae]|uniref:ABC-2 type transport system ATP-binding protein n=2 Tax=Nocardioides zeae TaxID=1457234 RepID=A0AAJ1U6D3_9ACTN|nr:ABC transporter ATP-binding protein [Nocardioides zeae]MDQ1104112.1 ABC-2 type transport system ATP-binding protein [Nocardioides zeae]MDR6176197.1 ABC-2 type transport system ATP-binding protein [Nocardioides zeae]MDR6210343.1 ABC-2 type transport system ATP-binding protein [Nocardioides zeae]
MTAVIHCTALTKKFGDFTALDAVDLTVGPGTVLGYLGPNGAGKSTTIRMLLGLSTPTSGSVRVLGHDPARDPAVRARIGYSPGELRLDDRLTVAQTLESWSRLRPGVDTAFRAELVDRFAVRLDKPVKGLSTGNRRKIGLVGAFMARPELLVLDEPTNGLDPLMQEVFLDTAAEAAAAGATILLSSHVMSEVERIADQVVVIRAGRVVASGTTQEMRSGAPLRVRVVFDGSGPSASDVARLPGAAAVEQVAPQELRLRWTGPPNDLLRLLAAHDVHTLSLPEPDLEDAFFEHYRSPAPTASSPSVRPSASVH